MSAPPRPKLPPFPAPEQVPAELRPLKRWVGWRAEWDESKGKWKKPPCSALTGDKDGWPNAMVTLAEALEGAKQLGLDGVGFCFVEGDGYVGIDFDDCRENETIHTEVLTWLKWLPTYQEISPSGTGIHAIARGTIKSKGGRPLPNANGINVEIYSKARYFTFTGQRVGPCDKIIDCQVGVERLNAHLGGNDASGTSPQKDNRPMSRATARKIHSDNLQSLRTALQGAGNDTLNMTVFFAARAFAAGGLDGTEESIKQNILDIVLKEWKKPHPEHSARQTVDSGWAAGLTEPLRVILPPQITWRNSTEQIVIKESPFILDHLIYQASSHGLIAKPKMGKTTIILDACDAILRGEPFLKYPTTPTSILYVSEQPLNSFQAELQNSGLLGVEQFKLGESRKQFWFITIEDWFKLDWPGIVEATLEYAEKVAAGLVIFDTLSRIARVENENDASEMQAAVDEMTPLIKAGIATLAVQHERKAGGDIFDAGRGTNALTGAVDALLRLNRPGSRYAETNRQLEFIGRFPGPDEPLILDRKTRDSASRYEVIGNLSTAKNLNTEQKILDLWAIDRNVWYTRKDIEEETEEEPMAVRRAIKKLTEEGFLEQRGDGKKDSPYEFRAKIPY